MMVDDRVFKLDEEDTVIGGTMMQALDPSEIEWVVQGKDPKTGTLMRAVWLGVELGIFSVRPWGVERYER